MLTKESAKEQDVPNTFVTDASRQLHKFFAHMLSNHHPSFIQGD
jgi:hypothetical protein